MLPNGQYCKPCKYDLQPGEEAIQDSMVRKSMCYENIDTLHPMNGGGIMPTPPLHGQDNYRLVDIVSGTRNNSGQII